MVVILTPIVLMVLGIPGISYYKDPVMNQSGFHGMSAKGLVHVAQLFLLRYLEDHPRTCKWSVGPWLVFVP